MPSKSVMVLDLFSVNPISSNPSNKEFFLAGSISKLISFCSLFSINVMHCFSKSMLKFREFSAVSCYFATVSSSKIIGSMPFLKQLL